jgi:hypothetical protein
VRCFSRSRDDAILGSKRSCLVAAGLLLWAPRSEAQIEGSQDPGSDATAPADSAATPPAALDTEACPPGPLSDAFITALQVELSADEPGSLVPTTLSRCDIATGHVDVTRGGEKASSSKF